MEGLSLEDLVPLEEFASRRKEFLLAHKRYVDRHRRVRIGPAVTLVFENRQTLWFRLQDVLRIARLADPVRVQMELDLYNRLLPRGNRLQAALLLEVDETRLQQELAPWRELRGDQLTLNLGALRYSADLLTCRPEDQCVGTAHWVQFALDEPAIKAFSQPRVPVHLSLQLPHYQHDSGPLGEDICRSLLEDLTLSAKKAG